MEELVRLENIIQKIKPVNQVLLCEGQQYCDRLAKPLGALGKMETIYARLYSMFDKHISLEKKVVVVYIADNGIVEEGISANPQETTYIVAENMLEKKTGLCAISQHVGSDVCVVDIGCKKDVGYHVDAKVMYGTKNMAKEPAMSKKMCIQAILNGYDKTVSLINQGYTLFGTGEMGVGNTTTSAAVISALLDKPAHEVTGYGAGLTKTSMQHKINIIEQCIQKHAPYEDVLDIVSKIGGLDMLGMVGTYLACAMYEKPCVIDGVISITGLLIASKIAPHVLDYCFASHCSTEPGYKIVADTLKLEPMLLMDMRLGEGSGCPLAFFLMENAVHTITNMPTFEQGKLSRDDYVDTRDYK
ncbi:nicotinate-nucleotide--dimethylbenzimidazole phosphoribosyltransferase [Granulicatella sp. zg-ZJ]|nr:nicotinate-nucleotide--dimethylbenzimidazole phosphoribosyltransferase [Granulicatella sp. zg-ZJ]